MSAEPATPHPPLAARARPFGALVRWLHRLDFDRLLPLLGRLPPALGGSLAAVRAALRAALGADWRSLALGQGHVGPRTWQALGELAPDATPAQRRRWLHQRYVAEARDELEARWLAGTAAERLRCREVPPGASRALLQTADGRARQPRAAGERPRGLVLLTAHHRSFILGISFLARSGARIHALKSAVTHDPRVLPAVGRHFEAKYAALQARLNGGRLIDIEAGVRPFYRMLERGDTVIVLADAPALAQGARVELPFAGARRALAGGALRLAQRTGSDIAAFTCRREPDGSYTLALSPARAVDEPGAVEAAYAFLSDAILADPGGWWAADLLPDMPALPAPPPPATRPPAPPPVITAPAAGPSAGAAPVPARPFALWLCTDSPLQGSAELDFGLAQLRQGLAAEPGLAAWGEGPAAAGLSRTVCQAVAQGADLLVLAHPALLVPAGLPQALAEALEAGGAPDHGCAVAATQADPGPMPPAYATRQDLQAYALHRRALPAAEDRPGDAQGGVVPAAYRLGHAAARQALAAAGGAPADWRCPPVAVGCVHAPRAYMHDWSDYRRHERRDMLPLLPVGAQRLLDVGGGEGGFARLAELEHGLQAWLLEPDAQAAAAAQAQGLRVLAGRLEDLGSPRLPLPAPGFDVITLLDVLEHLPDPVAALRALHPALAPGGAVVIATPNIGQWPLLRDLMAGRFDRLPVGALCSTHLHHFTAATLRETLALAGFAVEHEDGAAPADADDAALTAFLGAAAAAGLAVDAHSLRTPTLRVRARRAAALMPAARPAPP